MRGKEGRGGACDTARLFNIGRYWRVFSDAFGSQLLFHKATEEVRQVLMSGFNVHGAGALSKYHMAIPTTISKGHKGG